MIESILIILVGVFLIWVVRSSRKKHADVAKLSTKEREQLKQNVNLQPEKTFRVGWFFYSSSILVCYFDCGFIFGGISPWY